MSSIRFAFLHKIITICSIVALLSGHHAVAQIVVSGTSFNPSAGNAGRTYIGLNDIVQYGIQAGSITSTPPLAPNVNTGIFNATYYYAITDNPYKLDNTLYRDITATPDYQFVYSPKPSASGNTNILEYVVHGMLPGSAVSVKVDYCSAVSAANASCTGQRNEFKGIINADASNQLNGNDATQIGMGQCATTTYTGTVNASGDMIFRMNATKSGSCVAMGITNIEVTGFIKPIIASSQGIEVCSGEQINIQSQTEYNASYQWQVNTGSGWNNITGGTNESQLYEILGTTAYQFRLGVTPLPSGTVIYSDPITVTGITCCTVAGLPASRQTVYYDNFGRLDMTDKTGGKYFVWDYSNVLSPVEVAKTTATPFRWAISPAPLGATFRATGPPNDGEYTVAAFLTGYNSPINGYDGAKLEWANRVKGLSTTPNPDQTYDHSGQSDGAALFLNCPASTLNQVLYTRTINNLCFGKQLFFECWIAVFTNSSSGTYNPVNVKVKLTDGGNAANVVTVTGTATRQADGGGVWVRIAGQINLVGTSLQMDIINNQNVSVDGNDLVLDDIKIMACSPPSVDLFFDLATLAQQKAVCGSSLDLKTKASSLLTAYYGNAPMYIYQWTRTPTVLSSWQNLGTPQTAETFTMTNPKTHAAFTGLVAPGKVYFRIIAATAATYTANTNFTAPNYANSSDPCKNYSVSDPIEASVDCPLPVELLSFSGVKDGDENLLTWTTATEKNNQYFFIERSGDGKDFVIIGQKEGNGTTNFISNYRFYDKNPLAGINYYRLKQVDFNGVVSYTNVILINNGASSDIDIYPNPNNGLFTISLLNIGQDQSYKLDLLDVQGKIVYSTNGEVSSEGSVQVNGLSSGVYIARLYVENQVITKKLLVY